MDTRENLALLREIDETRTAILRGGVGQEARTALEKHLASLMARRFAAEDAAHPPPPALSPAVRAMTPEQAVARAAALRKEKLFFEHARPAQRAEQARLHAEVLELDRRAAEGT